MGKGLVPTSYDKHSRMEKLVSPGSLKKEHESTCLSDRAQIPSLKCQGRVDIEWWLLLPLANFSSVLAHHACYYDPLSDLEFAQPFPGMIGLSMVFSIWLHAWSSMRDFIWISYKTTKLQPMSLLLKSTGTMPAPKGVPLNSVHYSTWIYSAFD